jgi:hypothetical protein
MKNNVEKALDSFVTGIPEPPKPVEINKSNSDTNITKKVILDEREGLIERVDKIYVTKDGKLLLREQY